MCEWRIAMKVVSKIITGVVIAAAVAALGICSYMSTKVKYNAEGYIGNTSGNLINKGLFAEHNEQRLHRYKKTVR